MSEDIRRLMRLGGVVVREERVVPRWKAALAWAWLIIWTAAIAGGVAYYAYWQGHYNALRLTGCAL